MIRNVGLLSFALIVTIDSPNLKTKPDLKQFHLIESHYTTLHNVDMSGVKSQEQAIAH